MLGSRERGTPRGATGGATSRALHGRAVQSPSAFLILLAFLVTVLTVLLGPGRVVAHGGGTVRAQYRGAGYDAVIETNETPHAGFFGGTLHVTTIITAPDQPTVRMRNMDVHVTGEGPRG